MDTENLIQLETLLAERTQITASYTEVIIDHLMPTLGVAIINLLEIDTKHITWDDVEVVGATLVLSLSINYSSIDKMSEFLTFATKKSATSGSVIDGIRELIIGIPLSIVHEDSNALYVFMMNITKGMDPAAAMKLISPPTEPAESGSNSVGFNVIQLKELMKYQHTMTKELQ